MKPLNELAKEVHAANLKWWQDLETGKPIVRNRGNLLMLVITELSEAVEGIRKNLPDDKLPHRSMEEVEMADAFIRLLDYAAGFEIELCEALNDIHFKPKCPEFAYQDKAEAILEIVAHIARTWGEPKQSPMLSFCIYKLRVYCEKYGLDLEGAFNEKMIFNSTRQDHTHEARKSQHGKKF